LEIDCVGIHDNFYDLGGDSLAASRIVAKIVQHLQLEPPLRALFEAPTVAEMAAVITAHRRESTEAADLERVLAELEALSEEEAQHRLAATAPKPLDK